MTQPNRMLVVALLFLASNLASSAFGQLTPGGWKLEVVAVSGDPAPDGNGTFTAFNGPALNDAGQVAFSAALENTNNGSDDNVGIFVGTGSSGVVQIVREGQPAPEGNGNFALFNLNSVTRNFGMNLNDAGQVSFNARLNSTSGGTEDNTGFS